MFRRLLVVALCLLALPALASKLAVIVDPQVINVPTGLTIEQVKSAVTEGLGKRNWIWTEEGPNALLATVSPRDLSARIRVGYDTKAVTITYVDSTNLLYREANGVREIHQTYNRWISYLDTDIQNALAFESTPASPAAPASH